MPKYDNSVYDPAAPVAGVILRNISTNEVVRDVLLLIDSGADITLIPRAAAEVLGIEPLSGADYELLGFDGSRSKAQAVELDMIFLAKAYRGRYLLIDADRGVLGRDVMGNVALRLDGPRQEWSEHKGD